MVLMSIYKMDNLVSRIFSHPDSMDKGEVNMSLIDKLLNLKEKN